MKPHGEEKDFVIIQVYLPNGQLLKEEIDEPYEIIKKLIDKKKKGACVMITEDWNAVVSEGGYKNISGTYGLDHRNDRGTKLIEFSKGKGSSSAIQCASIMREDDTHFYRS